MLKNHFLTAVRNLLRNKGFSAINILGLSIGVASFLLIALYVYHEWSFDRFHTKGDRIFRIVENLRTENEALLQGVSSPPMGPAMAKDFPEVEEYVRMQGRGFLVKQGDNSFFEENCTIADSGFFRVFDFKLLNGDPYKALTEPKSVVITESIARKYFNQDNPIGQLLDMSGELHKVTGVVQDFPFNSHLRFDMIVSFSTWSSTNRERETGCWFCNGFNTYILLKQGADINVLRSKMPEFITRNIEKGGMYYEDLPLQPLKSIYLFETPRSWENGPRGSKANLYILSVIAMFIMLVAGFNYVNLATARASRRLKEVGLRKVLGAQRRSLIGQFLGESVVVSVLSTLLGVAMAFLTLPAFNTFVSTQLSFGMLPSLPLFCAGLICLAVVIGLLAGAYPALVVSGFEPLQMFRPSVRGLFGHQHFRKVLVAAQFVISIALVAGTLLVFDQLTMMRTRDLGFVKEATLIVPFSGNREARDKLVKVKNEFLNVPGIESITASAFAPGMGANNFYSEVEMEDGKLSATNINTHFVDYDFLAAYKIKLIAGRAFDPNQGADDSAAFIINETAMKDFGWTVDNAIGKKVRQFSPGEVIGVVKDFNYMSLHQRIEPLLMRPYDGGYRMFSMKLNSTDIPTAVRAVEMKWKELQPTVPFRYSFLEDDYNRLYLADAKLGKVAGVFASLAIFVGCLGLLGLTSFAVERRVKEIGVRKVLGASSGSIVFLISREFIGLILVAFVVAVPITYYMINQWLQNFSERISIGATGFLIAGVAVLAVAWATTSLLSFKAASTNPSRALRDN
jgi:putative ABC transport system permease protein